MAELSARCCWPAGLLNVLADISGMLDPYMEASVHHLRASIKEVIATPKPEPLPAPVAAAAALKAAPKAAPPVPPPPRPGRSSAPPPPPPGKTAFLDAWLVC